MQIKSNQRKAFLGMVDNALHIVTNAEQSTSLAPQWLITKIKEDAMLTELAQYICLQNAN